MKHCTVTKRVVRVVNLDPAAENFDYPVEAGSYRLSHLIVSTILHVAIVCIA